MDLNAAIKEIVSKILYKNRKKAQSVKHEVYNEQVEKFLNRSHDVENFDFGRAWIVENPVLNEAKKWVNGLEKEIIFNLTYKD
jgi:hypothetical protein